MPVEVAVMESSGEPALDEAIGSFAAQGYRVTSRSPGSAQLVKPKSASGLELGALGVLGIVLIVLAGGTGIAVAVLIIVGWAIWYISRRDSSVLLSLDAAGRVVPRGDVPRLPASMQAEARAPIRDASGKLLCPTCGRANVQNRSACKRCGQTFLPDPH